MMFRNSERWNVIHDGRGREAGIDDLVSFIRDADLWPEAFAGHLRAG